MDEALFDQNNKLAIRVCGDESESEAEPNEPPVEPSKVVGSGIESFQEVPQKYTGKLYEE